MLEELKTLYLAWQAQGNRKGWYPIGRLDVHGGGEPIYSFRYIQGALKAKDEAGFSALDGFPTIGEEYHSDELFPVFKNRLMSEHRGGFDSYLESLALPPECREPVHILAVSGGRRRTDALEVFPKIEPASEGHFELQFFLHGSQYPERAIDRIKKLQPGQHLQLVHELENQGTGLPALRVETLAGEAIGYTPNYMVSDFQYIRKNCLYPEHLVVERINHGNPLDSRVLLHVAGCWPEDYAAMMPEEFKELVLTTG